MVVPGSGHSPNVRDCTPDGKSDAYAWAIMPPMSWPMMCTGEVMCKVLGEEIVEVGREDSFRVACRGTGGGACAAVIRGDGVIAGGGKGHEDMPELVRGLGEAVDEEDGAFLGGAGGGFGFDVVDADFGVGLLEVDLTVGQVGVGRSHGDGCALGFGFCTASNLLGVGD